MPILPTATAQVQIRIGPVIDRLAAMSFLVLPLPPRRAAVAVDPDDARLLERAHAARKGWKFAALWKGDVSAYPSQSEADLALCNLLAFWTGGDAARIDRLFRQSGLMRAKWDERRGGQTYGERTIATAIAGCGR